MTDITYNKVKKYIEKYRMIEKNDLVAVGVSGGADSVCLLHILWRMRREASFRILAVHVDHGVRTDSAEDGAYVERLCRKLEIPFHLRKVDMNGYAALNGLSSEEAGRQLRYGIFEEVLAERRQADEVCKIAVAHNCNDRAETMLFHMFRGSGLKGLASIQPVRESVIRPLLCLERAEIEQYLAGYKLSYRQDSTNEEDTYTRNRIRHHILPYAGQEICSGAVAHMGELAEILSETESYLEEQTKQLYQEYVEENGGGVEKEGSFMSGLQDPGNDVVSICIQSGRLLSESPVMYKRVLLSCMERLTPHRKDITGQHITDLVQLMKKDGCKEIYLPYGIRAYKEYDKLYLSNPDVDYRTRSRSGTGPEGKEPVRSGITHADSPSAYKVKPPAEIFVPGQGTFDFILLDKEEEYSEKEQNIPQNRYTKWFDYDKITTSLLLRTRQQGDYLTIDAAMHTKSVKQYMINEKIPKMQRDSMYLLADGAHILWIPGYRISQNYKVDESTKRILQVRFRGGNNGRTN